MVSLPHSCPVSLSVNLVSMSDHVLFRLCVQILVFVAHFSHGMDFEMNLLTRLFSVFNASFEL